MNDISLRIKNQVEKKASGIEKVFIITKKWNITTYGRVLSNGFVNWFLNFIYECGIYDFCTSSCSPCVPSQIHDLISNHTYIHVGIQAIYIYITHQVYTNTFIFTFKYIWIQADHLRLCNLHRSLSLEEMNSPCLSSYWRPVALYVRVRPCEISLVYADVIMCRSCSDMGTYSCL